MNCDVYVYDDTLTLVSQGKIDATMETHTGSFIAQAPVPVAPLGPAMARLGPIPIGKVIEVYVDDTTFTYAPALLKGLNGDRTSRLDVSLFPLPSGIPSGAGGGPDRRRGKDERPPVSEEAEDMPTTDVSALSLARVEAALWTDAERAGVLSLYDVTIHAMAVPSSPRIRDRVPHWVARLRELGIVVPGDRPSGPGRGNTPSGAAPVNPNAYRTVGGSGLGAGRVIEAPAEASRWEGFFKRAMGEEDADAEAPGVRLVVEGASRRAAEERADPAPERAPVRGLGA